MSDPSHEDPDARVFRAALAPLRRQGPPSPDRALRLFAPGRKALEAAIGLAAVAIVMPVVSIAAIWFAIAARRAENPRGTAAVVAAVWCGVLGTFLRFTLGFPVIP